MAICWAAFAETGDVIRTAAELASASTRKGTAGLAFEVEATVLSCPSPAPMKTRRFRRFFIMDDSGGASVYDARESPDNSLTPGDQIVVSGSLGAINPNDRRNSLVMANCRSIRVSSHGAPPEPTRISPPDLEKDSVLNTSVIIDGILVEARQDEIDPEFTTFVLDCSGRMVYASIETALMKKPLSKMRQMVGATVEVVGIPFLHIGLRQHGRRWFHITDDRSITMLKPPSDDLFQAPLVDGADELTPEAVAALGRRRATGRVLAVWNGDTMLMRTESGEPMKVDVITSPPSVGDDIEAVGYAETDLFHVNLAHAVWRPAGALSIPPETVSEIDMRDLFANADGQSRLNAACHGMTIRLRGVVRNTQTGGDGGARAILDSGGYSIAADCSSAPDAVSGLCAGSTISVTGVCVLETETWNKRSMLPRTTGMFISIRRPEDVIVVSRPPWWTPMKLTVVIGALVLLLAGALAWNASLRILSERRGRELFRSQIEQAKSKLRVDERTRLAAELHDHLAQNLTAIYYQVSAASRARDADPDASAGHMDAAARMLGSCRTELRRCLWDLRSDALDEPDMAQTLRKSVDAVVGDAEISISFSVPRSKISDSTAHAILSIIRELAANAINHGHARHVSVEGAMHDATVRITVKDDGDGFDTATAPGPADGHFGLDGVRERLLRHNGTMSMSSSPGRGATVTLTLKGVNP